MVVHRKKRGAAVRVAWRKWLGLLAVGAAAQASAIGDTWIIGDPISTTKLLSSSPAPNETSVSVARETVLRFSAPLQPASVDALTFAARFGDANLPVRRHLSPDGLTVTLFYVRHLPSAARVLVEVDGSRLRDAEGRLVDVDGDGVPGGRLTIPFETMSLASIPGTAVEGRVFDSRLLPPNGLRKQSVNRPLGGVRIFLQGAEDRVFTTTDPLGNFRLENVPSGDFFVYIDGRMVTTTPEDTATAFPGGPYYPFVGKLWTSVPGQTTSVPEIYLPLVEEGTLVEVSATVTTTVRMPPSVVAANPEFAGVRVEVPPDALFASNGQRGGRVGLAPVEPERIPSPLPPGLELPIVITVQTDGADNFDLAVPVCFPNVDNPATPDVDERLAPGARSALWSFDHDTGTWNIMGTMTVSADGLLICSDPGVGIREPGWHGTAPSGRNKKKGPASKKGREGPAPDAPPPCQESGGEPGDEEPDELVATAQTFVAGAIGCMRGNRQAEKLFECRDDANQDLQRVMNVGRNLYYNLTEDSNSTRGDYRRACASFNARLSAHFQRATACGNFGDALQRFEDAARCLEAIQAAAASTCTKMRVQQGACAPPAEGKASCDALDQAKYRGDELRQMADAVRQANNRAIQNREELRSMADYLCDVLGAKAADDETILTAAERVLIRAAFQDVDDQAVLLVSDYADEVMALQPARLMHQRLADSLAAINRAATVYTSPSEVRRRFYLVEYANQIQRFLFPDPEPAIFLPGDVPYHLYWYDPVTDEIGHSLGITAPIGGEIVFETAAGLPADDPDTDNDGLSDFAEWIIGTDQLDPDSDGDGVPDGEEVRRGTNPLDGIALRTGIIAAAETPGFAHDVVALDNLLAVADGEEGITLFNIFAGLTPIRVGQLALPGVSTRVSIGNGVASVAAGPNGLHLIDVADPPNARLRRTIPVNELGGLVTGMAFSGGILYATVAESEPIRSSLLAIGRDSGSIYNRYRFGLPLADVALPRGHVAALSVAGHVLIFPEFNGRWNLKASLNVPGSHFGPRLFAEENRLLASMYQGYSTIELLWPADPEVLARASLRVNGFRGIVPNGSGIGLAPVAIRNFNEPADLDVYDLRDPYSTTSFLTTYATPGNAQAVAIYNGLGYVADGVEGLQVLNYLPVDRLGVPPTIQLVAPVFALERNTLEIRARVEDDVQVRQVEFYVDGERRVTVGGYPFVWRPTAPSHALRETMTVRARAVDTGGNAAWSGEQVINILRDVNPPSLIGTSPPRDGVINGTPVITMFFDEAIAAGSFPGRFQLYGAGPNRLAGDEDDVVINLDNAVYTFLDRSVSVQLPVSLPEGAYHAVLLSGVRDLSGLATESTYGWNFFVLNIGLDSDGDCLPDALEQVAFMDPTNPDTLGDGLLDGWRDFDSDGIPTCIELILGFDPFNPDSDNDGIPDNLADTDGDGTPDFEEYALRTDPRNPDTDGDGFTDGDEVADGTNPLDPNEFPQRYAIVRILPYALPLVARNDVAPASDTKSIGHVITAPVLAVNEGFSASDQQARQHVVTPMYLIRNTP